MKNLRTVMMHSVVGTLFNIFAIGYTMHSVATSIGGIFEGFTATDGLVFGAVIAAVDLVAVLATFESQHVEAELKSIVAGESLLNDGVAVVMYRVIVVRTLAAR